MLPETLKSHIGEYPDFPKKGILFKDISPILAEPHIFSELIKKMSSREIYAKSDAIVGIDSRGFIFGSAIANLLNKPLVLARKKNKLPGKLIEKDYGLEYGKDSLSMQLEAIQKFKRFVIVDDLIATGGTAKCVLDLLESIGKTIVGLHVVIELTSLEGKKALECPVYSEIKFD